jgi:hypothetical protein
VSRVAEVSPNATLALRGPPLQTPAGESEPVQRDPVLMCPVRLPQSNATMPAPAVSGQAVPFYLHEDLALDIRPLLGCLQLALSLESVEDGLIPMQALMLGKASADFALRAVTDAAYIEALRRHPLRRTEQKQAKLTLIATSPLLSASLPDGLAVCANLTTTTHVQRMEKVQRTLQTFLDKPAPHLVAMFCTGCTMEVLGSALHETIRRLRPLVLSAGVQAKENNMRFGPRKTVLLPAKNLGHFVVPSLALRPEWLPGPLPRWGDRLVKLAVDLDLSMQGQGPVRAAMTKVAARLSQSGLAPVYGVRPSVLRGELRRVLALSESQFVVVMDGKNFQTLFDAAAFGVVPLFLSDMHVLLQALPFPDQIAWDGVFFGVDGTNCLRDQAEAAALLLEKLIKTDSAIQWARVSEQLQRTYRQHLALAENMPDYRSFAKGSRTAARESQSDGLYDALASPAVESLLTSLSKTPRNEPAAGVVAAGLGNSKLARATGGPLQGKGGGGQTNEDLSNAPGAAATARGEEAE